MILISCVRNNVLLTCFENDYDDDDPESDAEA